MERNPEDLENVNEHHEESFQLCEVELVQLQLTQKARALCELMWYK